MKFEIRSINTRYKEGEIDNVQISYTARNQDRSISVNGNLVLSAEEYARDESIGRLEEEAKQHLLSEVK
jgi:hypothetical protein